VDLKALKRIVDTEYADISSDSLIFRGKLRAFLKDGSFIDVWFSLKITDRFSYHWSGDMWTTAYSVMIISQILTGKLCRPFPSIFITALKMLSRRAILMMIP